MSLRPRSRRWIGQRSQLVGSLLALALIAAACGSSESAETATVPAPGAAVSEPDSATDSNSTDSNGTDSNSAEAGSATNEDLSVYPAISVKDIATGDDLDLAALLADGDRATLLWFWAPH